MTVLPTNPGVVLVGTCLRDPTKIPGGRAAHGPARPPGPCPDCHDTTWITIHDPFLGGYLDARCPRCT